MNCSEQKSEVRGKGLRGGLFGTCNLQVKDLWKAGGLVDMM